MWHMCDWNWGWHGPTSGLMGLLWILLLGIVAALLLRWAVPLLRRRAAGSAATNDTPLEILRRRYARGEIGSEEFARVRKELV
jgi:putative membrane protein